MSAISAQNHSRSIADPSGSSVVAARHFGQASAPRRHKKIACLRTRQSQGVTRGMKASDRHPGTLEEG